ncbi:hypothetical protein UMM65_12605 [Aureibaculum sp. 2210JD6-5]|uniref:hypothetical protein n=1 Tax=Aureibaculum sp. 2210JD6-5 TaxID=3103957 RepID=UPI002AAD1E99|nr:hypothetical protein [Aureibaculum sp. 2210JD6-5]MDY7396083.1 hypothetical protein [Aureibaculum sp. 2210JD6-5]
MKKQVISQANDWSQWTPELKEALKASTSNTQVGQKLVYENNEFRVWSIHLPAGQSLPFHKHANRYFWTAMSTGKSRSYYNDGSIVETEYEIGDTKYFGDLNKENFFIHSLENIGDTMLIYTTVEFLK